MRTKDVTTVVALAVALVGGPVVQGADGEYPLADWGASDLGVLANSLPTNPLTFVGIVPCRMADTRNLSFPPGYGPPALPAGTPRNFVLTGRCGIPAEALAVSANVTAVSPSGPGFLLIRPTDGPNVVVSTLNFIPGQTVANAAAVPLGTGGAATFLAGVSGTELIIDVNGYYVEAPTSTADITAVTAGTGLLGGATSGDATLSVDPATTQSRVTGACAAGSSIRTINENGTVTCEVDTDTNTTYTVAVGGGLSLNGSNQFAVANGGITAAMIGANSVTAAAIATDAVGASEIATDAVGSSEIATSAVTNSEIADSTIRRAEISGSEVAVYTNHADCASSPLTLATTCSSELCQTGPPILFRNCSGACVSVAPVSCANTLRGYLLGPTIP
jgi:hypothetical protein